MNAVKRSFLYLLRKYGKTLSLFLFLLVMATMMLTCLSLFSATQDAESNLKKALMSSFTVNAKQLESGLTKDTVTDILSLDGLSGQYALRSYTQASYFRLDGTPLEIETEGASQIPQGYEHAGKVVANSNSNNDTYFTEAGFKLIEGNAITQNNGNIVLLHKDFAERNGLFVGDDILLGNVSETDRRVKVTIIGLFNNTQEQDALGIAPSYDLYSNVAFTDIATGSYLIYGNGTINAQYGDFYVNDPEELYTIMSAVKELPNTEWEDTVITKYDNDYQNAKDALKGLLNIIFIAMIVIGVVCFLVLSLFLVFRLRSRIHETGVLLAMGISKSSVLLQYLLEIIVVAIIAFGLSFLTSSLIAQEVGDKLFAQTMQDGYEVIQRTDDSTQDEDITQSNDVEMSLPNVTVSISLKDYLSVFGIGMVLCVLSVSLALIPILRMKPKNILSQMN